MLLVAELGDCLFCDASFYVASYWISYFQKKMTFQMYFRSKKINKYLC